MKTVVSKEIMCREISSAALMRVRKFSYDRVIENGEID